MNQSRHEPTIVTLADVEAHFGELLAEVRAGRRVVVAEGEVAVAALVSPDDAERLGKLDADRDAMFAAMERISEAFNDLSVAEIEELAARAVSEARAEIWSERNRANEPIG